MHSSAVGVVRRRWRIVNHPSRVARRHWGRVSGQASPHAATARLRGVQTPPSRRRSPWPRVDARFSPSKPGQARTFRRRSFGQVSGQVVHAGAKNVRYVQCQAVESDCDAIHGRKSAETAAYIAGQPLRLRSLHVLQPAGLSARSRLVGQRRCWLRCCDKARSPSAPKCEAPRNEQVDRTLGRRPRPTSRSARCAPGDAGEQSGCPWSFMSAWRGQAALLLEPRSVQKTLKSAMWDDACYRTHIVAARGSHGSIASLCGPARCATLRARLLA